MNQEIRDQIKAAGLKQWEVAKMLGVAESTFIRWLRDDLSEGQRAAISKAIEDLQKAEVSR